MSVLGQPTWDILTVNNSEMGVLRYEISDSGRHTAIGYLNIWIPIKITKNNRFYVLIDAYWGQVDALK